MKNPSIKAELYDLFGDIQGPVRLHWEGDDDSEDTAYYSLDAALDDVVAAAIRGDYTAAQIEKIAYIITEAEWLEQQAQYAKERADEQRYPAAKASTLPRAV